MKLGFSGTAAAGRVRRRLPIRVGGELVGGIGVSGASEDQDGICARAGACSRSAPTTSSPERRVLFRPHCGHLPVAVVRRSVSPLSPDRRAAVHFLETTQPQRKTGMNKIKVR